jgi:hypothetical protein
LSGVTLIHDAVAEAVEVAVDEREVVEDMIYRQRH